MRNFRRLVLGLLLVSLAGASFAAMDHKPVNKHSNLLVLECLGLTSNAILDEPRIWVGLIREPTNLAYFLGSKDLHWTQPHFLSESPRKYAIALQRPRLEGFGDNLIAPIYAATVNRQTGKATINSHTYECKASSLQQIDDWVLENVATPKF